MASGFTGWLRFPIKEEARTYSCPSLSIEEKNLPDLKKCLKGCFILMLPKNHK